jgi:hypothetical protein
LASTASASCRIRHYGLFAKATRKDNLAQARKRLACEIPELATDGAGDTDEPTNTTYLCPACAAPMTIIETFQRWHRPRAPPTDHENRRR